MAAVLVPVNPAVLRWARESLDVSIKEAAEKTQLDESVIESWESGTAQPSIGPLRELAGLYRRPFAAFLLPAVPKGSPPPADLRRAAGTARGKLSRTTRLALARAAELRDIAAELETGEEPAIPRFNMRTLPSDVAIAARTALGVTMQEQRSWRSANEALNVWRRTLELSGVVVLTMSMPISEVRAFSLSTPGLPPVIVLNSSDSETGRSFSLFHEYGHVLLGSGGICLPHEGPRRHLAEEESYCNSFAGAFLVPDDALKEMAAARALGETAELPSDGDIAAVAARFRVSKQVLWYRLRDLDFISRERFAVKWAHWRAVPIEKRATTPKIPTRIRVLSQRGVRFTGLVYAARDGGDITNRTLLDYLGIRVKDIDEVEAELRRRAVG